MVSQKIVGGIDVPRVAAVILVSQKIVVVFVGRVWRRRVVFPSERVSY